MSTKDATGRSHASPTRRGLLGSLAGAALAGNSGLLLQPSPAWADADLDALIKAAKAEPPLSFYTAITENVARRVSDAVTAKFGIKTQFIRLPSGALMQRYAAESQAGNTAADLVIIAGGATAFLAEGFKNGWLESVADAGLPVVKTGEFPAGFLRQGGALIQIAPWLIVYNTDSVKPDAVPKGWKDIFAPRFKGRILVVDPATADSHLDVWGQLADTFGPDFFAALRAQNPRIIPNAVPAVQALAAGEGDLAIPAIRALVQATIDKGAPLDTVLPNPATGVEMYMALTNRGKAKSPNAARLFANYLMSKEGNQLFNAEPGSYSIYDMSQLPKEYASPKPETVGRKAELRGLLGIK